MTRYFMGVDVGSTKTHALIADETGRAAGFGTAGPGNHEVVGYDGLAAVLGTACRTALAAAGLTVDDVAGAGFGVAGYDWPSERAPTLEAIASLGLRAPLEAVNDTTLGLLAGAAEGWGVAVVSGTGCNARGWDRGRRREGKVTGNGIWLGEAAGASELVVRAVQALAHCWTQRGPATALAPAFVDYAGVGSLDELLEGLVTGRLELDAEAAPLVFRVAAAGDAVAGQIIHWAGCELGELACAVIRQLGFEALDFDVVLVGSMFDGGPPLVEPMQRTIHALAPGARLVRLAVPPVIGAVLLGMEQAGLDALARRAVLVRSMPARPNGR
jgi:N-acetylglucosamine kinase-like BadF-type ATPase